MKEFLTYSLYPLTLIVASMAYLLTFQLTHLHALALYSGVSSSAVLIFLAEKIFPLHAEWIPTKDELLEDVFFYSLIVQVLFPLLLFYIGITSLKYFGFKDGFIVDLWPHQLPKFIQFLILAIAGEFFQYWWHRLCHTFQFLWPIHAPHHFPKKLYSWNTSRFHFFDKLVEFFFTIFIFVAIGLSFEIFSYYYLFYAITGYIQHSNFDVKLGWFDYIIASGETHRFHHDSNLSKSKCNYANNFVLFDLLFNTFKRNPSEINKVVGVRSKNIPHNIKEEILYPINQFKLMFFKAVLKLSMELVAFKKVKQLRKAALDPLATQNDLLLGIIKNHESTIFGYEHDFKNIKSIEDYKLRVPIRDYEEHRPYIERILNGEVNSLSSLSPHYFTKTSGTTGKPKYIPINLDIQNRFINSQQILSYSLFLKDPRYLDGDIFSVVGNECEEMLNNKWPCGSMSGKLYSLAHKTIRNKHIFQKEMATLNDSDKKYFYLAALALLSPNTTFYVSPNPSTLIKIFDVINSKKAELMSLIEEGRDPIIKKHSNKFNHALALLQTHEHLKVEDVWPNLHIISLWMEGSCSYLIPQIKKHLSPETHLSELGFLCSEFYGTLPVDADTSKQIPTLLDNFFEFIEKNDYEAGIRETLLLHELKLNSEYYIIVTTSGGFYRYFINDLIKVTGFYHQTPIITFSQKGKGVTNITGEKISEKQLVSFFEEQNHKDLKVKFFICLADQEAQSYALYLEANEDLNTEALSRELDLYLRKVNVEYASKVSDQRLRPMPIYQLKNGTGEIYRNHCVKKGQSEVQFKFLYLQYLSKVDFPFKSYLKK